MQIVSPELPRISIVTPSYNSAVYLDTTMRSILDQGYPNLEYIVVDGGSTDGSIEIIRRYEHRLAWWVSEPDSGPYDAINKGFSHATGEIMAWLNADDIYLPTTLALVTSLFKQFPQARWLAGNVGFINSADQFISTAMMTGGVARDLAARGYYRHDMAGYLTQEGMFWRRDLWEESGGRLDTNLRLAADFELWTRFARYAAPVAVKCLVAGFRRHPKVQRSGAYEAMYREEVGKVCQGLPKAPLLWKWFGRTTAANQLYLLFFVRGRSESIGYDLNEERWVYKYQDGGRLYRPFVIGRKI